MLSNIYRTSLSLALLIASAAVTLCANAAEPKAEENPVESQDVEKISSSINEFAFELYGHLAEKEGSLFFSPASISTALAMTYAGAEGETEAQMAKVLHFTDDGTLFPRERFYKAYGALTTLLNSAGTEAGYQLSMANRLWGQKTFPFQPEFLTITREDYGAELAQVDFADAEQARQQINTWVEEQTNGKIEDLIPAGVLGSETRLVLANAIYFKGAWREEFSKDATKDAPFHLSQDRQIEVPMMHQTAGFPYAESDDLQLLKLPYVGDDLSMVILLPTTIDGLADLEKRLTAENVGEWTSGFQKAEVRLQLPKFKLTSQFQLADVLRALGMTLPFSEQADFSGISSAEGLWISEVVHEAFVDVNEEGTEAAAATGVAVTATAAIEPQEPVVFNADHPFVFLIQDNRSQAVLFIGRVVNPQE